MQTTTPTDHWRDYSAALSRLEAEDLTREEAADLLAQAEHARHLALRAERRAS